MTENRVKIQNIVENQLPLFVIEEYPLLVDFLKQYYISQEYQGSSADIIQNIDKYIKLEESNDIIDSTILESDLDSFDDSITITNTSFINSLPKNYGLIKIDDEIITYTGITTNSLTGCIRGFSGITSLHNEELIFSSSIASEHAHGTVVYNLSILFLKEFLKKTKKQLVPGFEDTELYSGIDERLFITQSKDFYTSKGTDNSFKILFKALYGEDVEVIKPRDFLFIPSDAEYRVTKDIVVQAIDGNPLNLLNKTLFQDNIYDISQARGSITNIEPLYLDGATYYKLSLDYGYNKDINVSGSILSEFSVHPKTTVINSVSIGDTIIDVDSTVGFPTSGELITTNGLILIYTSKSINQFYGIIGVTSAIAQSDEIRLNVFAYGYEDNSTNKITVRIGSVLEQLKTNTDTYLYYNNDTIKIRSLGKISDNIITNSLIHNTKVYYYVQNVELISLSTKDYRLTTYDATIFQIGDIVVLNDTINGKITTIANEKKFEVKVESLLTIGIPYTIERNILKGYSTDYSELTKYNANIQNSYVKFNDDTLITSTSLPNYYNEPTNPYSKIITILSGQDLDIQLNSFGDHGFYTGDSVYYGTSNLFVYRVDKTTIKLATSKSNIFNNKFISFTESMIGDTISYFNFHNKSLTAQNIVRQILPPSTSSGTFNTKSGPIGILINGVEILNYKSLDYVAYGGIESIEINNSGNDYDVSNPPILEIIDSIGVGASAICAVTGELKRLNIINTGFDFVQTPTITITGGNGVGAKAEANMTKIDHIEYFNATTNVNLITNIIGFTTYHKFRDNEKVIYQTDGQTAIAGLTTNSTYYANIIDGTRITLHNTKITAIAGTNAVNFTSYGSGIQSIKAAEKKQIISNIVISNPGSTYQNKKRVLISSGINTALDQFTIKSHGYNTGEIVVYSSSGNSIGGLSTTSEYFIKKIDNDMFSLYNSGITTLTKTFYYDNDEITNITSIGSGEHSFNYPNIVVNISGIIGVSTRYGQDFSAKIQPIVRGGIDSINVSNSGVGYGSSEILNYNKPPQISFNSGSGAKVTPIINNGQIVDIIVDNSGSGYNSLPNIVVSGTGNYQKLTPVIENEQLISIKIIYGGIGFDYNTTIEVVPSGSGCVIAPLIQKWTINLFDKNLNIFKDDDGIIDNSTINLNELQYFHLYPPRSLRKRIFSKNSDGEIQYGVSDLQLNESGETQSTNHSPIIGWAYDGNPIYGPYGYDSITGGSIRIMKSGYEPIDINNEPNRPNFSQVLFVEDYKFTGNGDLDEHNGRFCVTPDFPNGTYAYFSTIKTDSTDSGGTFKNYRKPQYPYFIGNTYKSKPNEFNYDKTSNQNELDLQNTDWFRNTKPYNQGNYSSGYNYIFNPNNLKNQYINITSTSAGGVENINIISGGDDYRINDRLVFDNSETKGSGAYAKVSKILGRDVNQVSISSTELFNIEFTSDTTSNKFIGFSTSPHSLNNLDLVSISGLNTSILKGNYQIGIRSDNFILTKNVNTASVTGITTYFYVSGQLVYPTIRENDILQIESEQIKVLNVDKENSRIRVLRNISGSSHTASTILYEKTRKFRFNAASNTGNFPINKEIYFDPNESVGIGTTSGTTITFTSPGIGLTQIHVPRQSIYLPNHGLKTGDSLIYSNNGDGAISILVSTPGVTPFYINDTVYTSTISKDFIGLSTTKVGSGTTNLLYFNNVGNGKYHSFKTQYNGVVGQVSKNVVTVSTEGTHGLSVLDSIDLEIKPTTTITVIVRYDDYNRRIVFDPVNFVSSDVNITDNTIQLTNNKFKTGDKVIHTAAAPAGGLENEKIYYVILYDNNRIKLVSEKYQLNTDYPEIVNITSTSSGTISKVTPIINVRRNNTLKFDLSDTSLSHNVGITTYSAFNFNFYSDSNFNTELYTTKTTNNFEVTKSGTIGIDSTSNVSILISDEIPNIFYYKFTPINYDYNSVSKLGIVNDSANQINVIDSEYTGSHSVVSVAATTFTFNLFNVPESTNYTPSNSIISYQTNSPTAYGPISNINITNNGIGYQIIPGISSVTTSYGTGSILKVKEGSIGKILDNKIQDIGFDYPTDFTLRPVANLPEIYNVDPLSIFDTIEISSGGKNYITPPGLVAIDSFTNEIITDVDLQFTIGATEVKILKNTDGIYNVTPRIIPVNNSNGVGISSVEYDSVNKWVTLSLSQDFSELENFPFAIGDNVLVENIGIVEDPLSSGYNSEDYNYQLFQLVDVLASLGGSGAYVTYSLANYLSAGKVPGVVSSLNTSGRVIPENHFPRFNIKLRNNNFYLGEVVKYQNNSGIVESWNNNINYIKVSTTSGFNIGDVIVGQSSNTSGSIKSKITFDAEILLNSFSIIKSGWSRNTGFLNDNIQRTPDNNYYQYFSYALKSKVPFATWDDPVNSLNHIAGFLKFGDLVVESIPTEFQGISSTSNIDVVTDIVGTGNLNYYYDFDLANEKTINVNSKLISDEIILKNRILTDYYESISNRVLVIDDVSPQFNTDPKTTKYSVLHEFDINSIRSIKYFTLVNDIRSPEKKQFSIVSLLHDDYFGYINQYAKASTQLNMGSYDFSIFGSKGRLLFYPIDYKFSEYTLGYIAFNLSDIIEGTGNTPLGNIVDIQKVNTSITGGNQTTIVGIASTYRSSKVLIEISGSGNIYEFNEYNLIHDGTNIDTIEYGQLTNLSVNPYSNVGLGTYSVYYSGANINIDFIPNVGVALTANVIRVSMANTSVTGIGTVILTNGFMNSQYTSIPSSVTPIPNIIAGYNNSLYNAAYYCISVEDTTNNRYELSEAIIIDDGTTVYSEDFANLRSSVGLGTISADISSGTTTLKFTPLANINTQIRVFQLVLSVPDEIP